MALANKATCLTKVCAVSADNPPIVDKEPINLAPSSALKPKATDVSTILAVKPMDSLNPNPNSSVKAFDTAKTSSIPLPSLFTSICEANILPVNSLLCNPIAPNSSPMACKLALNLKRTAAAAVAAPPSPNILFTFPPRRSPIPPASLPNNPFILSNIPAVLSPLALTSSSSFFVFLISSVICLALSRTSENVVERFSNGFSKSCIADPISLTPCSALFKSIGLPCASYNFAI